MCYTVVANVAVATHFGFLALGILGGFLAWRRRWRWVLWLQVVAAAWLVLVVAAHLPCPLTGVEDHARERAGLPPHPGGFLDSHVAGVSPHGHERAAGRRRPGRARIMRAGVAVMRRRCRARCMNHNAR